MKFFKKSLLSAVILSTCSVSFAETRGFMSFDLGFGDSDFDNDIVFDIGGGIQFNEHVEFELAYNRYGDIAPFGISVTSISYGLNLGGKVSENTRLYGIIGAERLEADDTVDLGIFSISVDESSTEAYFGVGANFTQSENVDLRTRFISHDSGEFWSLTGGFVIYF